ncbi:MAG: hypothetical protein QX199_13805 [Methylococcaceae bacterium]
MQESDNNLINPKELDRWRVSANNRYGAEGVSSHLRPSKAVNEFTAKFNCSPDSALSKTKYSFDWFETNSPACKQE